MTLAVAFDAATHVYTVNDVVVPHVTQILKAAGLGVDYSMIDPRVLENARERGEYVDQCCDLDDEGVLELDGVHPLCVGYVQAWRRFRAERGFTPMLAQPLLYHPEHGYCGRPDTDGLMELQPTVVDRKCVTKVDRAYGLQLAAYTMAGIRHVADGELLPFLASSEPTVRLVV